MLTESLAGLVALDPSHLVVTDSTGAIQVLGTDYTITGNLRTGTGSIRTLRAFSAGAVVTVRRITDRAQQAALVPTQPMPAKRIEAELDRSVLIAQEQDAQLGRALKVPLGENAPALGSVALARTGQVLGFVGDQLVPIEVGQSDSKRIAWVTPEMFGALGDARVTYDSGGVAIAYAGTDDTVAVAAAFSAAMAAGAEVRLSRWYRITSPLPTMTSPYAIVGIGRLKCGLVMDAAMAGAALTISECWMGRDTDEIKAGQNVRDPAAIYSGLRLEGFGILGSRSSPNVQHGIVLRRHVDKLRMRDVGAYHVRGCGLWMGYDDRAVGASSAYNRECDIQFEARWCGYLAGGYAAIRYWSFAYAAGDDASNNNVFDIDCYYSDGIGLHVSCRTTNTTGASIRYDKWSRVMVELAGSHTVLIEGSVINSQWEFIEFNPTTAGTYGMLLQEWAGQTTAAAGFDKMPRNLVFSGVNGGRAGTSGVRVINGLNIDFHDLTPSSYRAQGGTDYHLIVESTVVGIISLSGAASEGYRANISCDASVLRHLKVDIGKYTTNSASLYPILSSAGSMVYVPDAFAGSTPGMAYSNGAAWMIWPVSILPFRSDDQAVAAGTAKYQVRDCEVVGSNTQAAEFRVFNGSDATYQVIWRTPTLAGNGTLATIGVLSPVALNGAFGEAPALSFTPRGHLLANQGVKLVVPQYTIDSEPSLLYRGVIGDLNLISYQPGAYASRRGIGWRNGVPTAAAPPDAKGGWLVLNTEAALGGVAGWISLASDGSWVPIGIVGGVKAAAQADSTASDIATLKADFNALLAKLRSANLMG